MILNCELSTEEVVSKEDKLVSNDSEFQELSDNEAAILKSNSYFEDISFMGNTDATKRKREDSDVCGSDTKIQI
jgi:hypothetical protein